ncbi:glycosyltransferase family 4 protein [Luteipulveratus flavus]|uniref:Glycosyltransferase family 4 protein n=1 Tax=Luteipulveratus flavus TaxID=3031728 RepID=A0ABT6C9N1_9MICO|nr:glycosyltransferase family 4 protein [Luteipulveratus sp. YIM 133296]MDF8265510.1 glycosyltransferase family 4 protein [Luteipulveratus sp. YIM 133296]
MRIALSSYRSKPHSGGQGIYVRNLSRELARLGHEVEVFSGQPYPELDEGVGLTRLPSLDLYRPEDPFRRPGRSEFRDGIDVLEFLTMCTSGFPEPRTFSLRLARHLRERLSAFDILHDNQTLGPGLLQLARRGMPVLTTIHHPISQDRRLELEAAHGWDRITKRRWYGFVAMQRRVAQRSEHLLTVSEQSARDIVADFGVRRDRLDVVPVGVDTDTFTARPYEDRVAGRLVAVVSADVPLKGLTVLVAALATLDRSLWQELVVVGNPGDRTLKAIADAGLADRIRFEQGLPTADLAALIASAQVHVVPSLYEGFSLPTVEAMACGTAVVASEVGALPELLGPTAAGEVPGVLVAPGDPDALATAIGGLLRDPERCARMGAAGRERAETTYSWASVAAATAQVYARIVQHHEEQTA